MTSVKDQKSCGSCWAFATVGAIEASYLIALGGYKNYSEQSLMDCGPGSCAGGLTSEGMKQARDYGIDSEFSYPYVATD